LCICNWGSCSDGDNLSEVCENKELKLCEVWTCDDGCCNSEKQPEEECCTADHHCEDCTDLETGETTVCPEDAPEGSVKNLCTTQSCDLMQGACTYEPVNVGDCDDDNECTLDSCDPATGECGHVIDPDVPECNVVFCWGAGAGDADIMCDDSYICSLDVCEFGGEFVPWEGEDPPDTSDPDNLPPEVGLCSNIEVEDCGPKCLTDEECDDANCCTKDSCYGAGDGTEGVCLHDWTGIEPLTCFKYECEPETCEPIAAGHECDDENPCTLDECVPLYGEEPPWSLCVNMPVDCDDEDSCTFDSCDPETGECVNEAAPFCEGQCLVSDDCPPPEDCCAQSLCLFEPGAEIGECAELALTNDCASCLQYYCDEATSLCVTEAADCDDGDECTLDDCECNDEPFGSACVHEDVPDC